MTTSGFTWVVPPDVLTKNIEQFGEKLLVAVQAAATYWGQHIQNEARIHAPWMDRTGHARSGLFFAVDGFGFEPIFGEVSAENDLGSDVDVVSGNQDTLIIVLAHTVFYGKYLESPEFRSGGKYAVIISTIEANLPMLERLLAEYARRIT